MTYVKSVFSIKDLENISGIKAHTIRIWEKRYNLFEPQRTDTNIRYYDINSLNKLLNIKLLNDSGIKISKIATYTNDEIISLVKETTLHNYVDQQVINALTFSMFAFDQRMFNDTYNKLLSEKSFREIFKTIFIPFLNNLGWMWQTQAINPAHEHFVSNIIKQKIIFNTEKITTNSTKKDFTFVLYLPDNEIHELGLLYLNYELILKGYSTIYLGQTIPIDSLIDLQKSKQNIVFVSYFTVEPAADQISEYLNLFSNTFSSKTHPILHIMGEQAKQLSPDHLPESIVKYNSPFDFLGLF